METLYEHLLKNYKLNEQIFLADLQIEGMSRANLRLQIKKLTDAGKVKRFDNGVYFLPKKTIFKSGSQLPPEKVLECKYLRDKDKRCGYVSGLMFFNQMGLTIQVPMLYKADLIVVSNLEQFTVEQVYKGGFLVAEGGKVLKPSPLVIDSTRFARVMDSFDMDEITMKDLELHKSGEHERVIRLIENELLTEEEIIPFRQYPGIAPGVDVAHKIVKLAVFERHHHSGHVGLGFLGNYSLQCGAVASSIAHDSHNLIVAGTNDTDMVLAGNTVRKNKGGLAFVVNGRVIGELALPVAGLMSAESVEVVMENVQHLKDALRTHGIAEGIDPFMTLAFVSLPVIPKLRLNTYGIVDVKKQRIVPAVF